MSEDRDKLKKLIAEKACMKQDVFHNIIKKFKEFEVVLKNVSNDIDDFIKEKDSRVGIDYTEVGDHEVHLKMGGDLLIFQMHTNVFKFDGSNPLWNSSYLSEDPARGYCGVINVYNFLADSVKYSRFNDSGYLVARIFINREDHYMVQGKRQLGFLYNNFTQDVLKEDTFERIIESIMLYTLDFDLLVPPYDNVKEITVHALTELSSSLQLKTGKRLGFQFNADTDEITL